jgi:hypothetical protein
VNRVYPRSAASAIRTFDRCDELHQQYLGHKHNPDGFAALTEEQRRESRVLRYLRVRWGRDVREVWSDPLKDGERYYHGLAIGSFDGHLKMMDARGQTLRAKLITTAGELEIDCVLNKLRLPEVREMFGKRVRIEGTAHYDKQSPLPLRVDVNDIRLVKENADLTRWRGRVSRDASFGEEW